MGHLINKLKIGVFDSGLGGKSVAEAIRKVLPDYKVIYRHDQEHVPYGLKPPEQIMGYIVPIFEDMVADDCDVIVIACNTVTTTLIGSLRERFSVPLIGLEPMVKPAAQLTKSGVIAVCATPTTLASPQYRALKREYAHGITVLEPNCEDWASMIEHDAVDDEKIKSRIESVVDQGADVIVLACTHYHWIEQKIKSIASTRAKVIQPESAIIRQLQRVLETIQN